MLISLVSGRSLLAVFVASTSLIAYAAAAQDSPGYWQAPNPYYPPGDAGGPYSQGGYTPRLPYAQNPYNPGPYNQGSYAQGPYSQEAYGETPAYQGRYVQAPNDQNGQDYNPYDAQRRAWAQRQWRQQQAAYAARTMPAPYAPPANEALTPPPAAPPAALEAPVAPTSSPAPASLPQMQALAAAPLAAPALAAVAVAATAGDPMARPTADIGAPAPLPAVGSPGAALASAAPPTTGPVAPPPLEQAQPAAPTARAALAPQIVQSASAYLSYMKAAAALSPLFTDGDGVAREVRAGAAYEPKQFQEGAIAYAAIIALQEPTFVQGVLAAAGGDPARVQSIAASLIANPDSARTFSGADAASARASAALRRQGDSLMTAGLKMKQEAYDVQHADWSKSAIPAPEVGLAAAKTLSATRLSPTRDETGSLLKLALAEQNAGFPLGEGASSAVLRRGLALAALAILGQAGEENVQRDMSLMADHSAGECLSMAKLNLFQCLAVAGPHYEDIFCLGQHAMIDTAQCVISASGTSRPATTVAALAPRPAPVTAAPQDYWVPMAGLQMAAAAP